MPKAKTPKFTENQVVDQVISIIKFMGENRLAEIELETSDLKLNLKKHSALQMPVMHHVQNNPLPVLHIEPSQIARNNDKAVAHQAKPAAEVPANFQTVVSPMTGTFYRAPSPDSQPFIKEGDVIKAGQTICIVEAMKMMNEIKSDKAGKIVKIVIENGKPVEKGAVIVHIGE
jgi:acetyl-CoA carboxylase biotin carboxyl carrier protein